MTHGIPDQRPCTPLLDAIHLQNDLRRLHRDRLPTLASELRQFLLYTVGQTGGHLGAGLGVVELTLALHYVFNTPEDRLVWDVGHQCYPHKILTGRREQIATLRLRCIPNMVIMTPSNEQELWWMLNTGYQHFGPVAVRYPRGSGNGSPVEQSCKTLPFGKGHITTRKGKDHSLACLRCIAP